MFVVHSCDMMTPLHSCHVLFRNWKLLNLKTHDNSSTLWYTGIHLLWYLCVLSCIVSHCVCDVCWCFVAKVDDGIKLYIKALSVVRACSVDYRIRSVMQSAAEQEAGNLKWCWPMTIRGHWHQTQDGQTILVGSTSGTKVVSSNLLQRTPPRYHMS